MVGKQYRNEWKYIVTDANLAIIESRLKSALKLDENAANDGKYEVHSLYFDDIYDTCIRDNDHGTSKRFKYRIRYYDNNPGLIRLERKEKLSERCHKESCILSLQQFNQIINGEIEEVLWNTDDPVLSQFCVHCMTRGFAPKAIIDYERVAYVEPISNVRITLDTHLSVSNAFEHFLTGSYLRMPLQEAKRQVLEVKFDYILPSYIRHMLTSEGLVRTSLSKYSLGRKQLRRKGL